jgi:hypothetical protein
MCLWVSKSRAWDAPECGTLRPEPGRLPSCMVITSSPYFFVTWLAGLVRYFRNQRGWYVFTRIVDFDVIVTSGAGLIFLRNEISVYDTWFSNVLTSEASRFIVLKSLDLKLNVFFLNVACIVFLKGISVGKYEILFLLNCLFLSTHSNVFRVLSPGPFGFKCPVCRRY